jgi:hypothetical protein
MTNRNLDEQLPTATVLWEAQGPVETIDYHVQAISPAAADRLNADILASLQALEEQAVLTQLAADAVLTVEVLS